MKKKNNKSYRFDNHMKDIFSQKESEIIINDDEFNRTKHDEFSDIIKTNQEINLILKSITPNFLRYSKNKKSKFEMIYKSLYDGNKIKNLHKIYDNITNLLLFWKHKRDIDLEDSQKLAFIQIRKIL